MCINNSKKVDLFYLCSKLHLSECNTITDLVDSITELSECIESTTTDGFGIDYLFRALLIALESKHLLLSVSKLHNIRDNLDFFMQLRDTEVLFEKYSISFV
ncbi:hypothetical protein D3C73_1340900 [compost metagenome]